jgi:hypothetical protein
MPKQGWIDFTDAHHDGHVIVALVLPRGRPARDEALIGSLRATLESLIERLGPSGAYATKIVPQNGIAEIYCVFEKEADAQRLADGRHHPGDRWKAVPLGRHDRPTRR